MMHAQNHNKVQFPVHSQQSSCLSRNHSLHKVSLSAHSLQEALFRQEMILFTSTANVDQIPAGSTACFRYLRKPVSHTLPSFSPIPLSFALALSVCLSVSHTYTRFLAQSPSLSPTPWLSIFVALNKYRPLPNIFFSHTRTGSLTTCTRLNSGPHHLRLSALHQWTARPFTT
jgi:hypothetical protein